MAITPYSKLQSDNSSSRPAISPADSFELQSLASSSQDDSESTPPSRGSRDLEDLDDFDNNDDIDDDDYQRLLLGGGGGGAGNETLRVPLHNRSGSTASTIGDLVFVLPETRDRRTEMEVPLEKQNA